MSDENFALEVLRQEKLNTRRWFIITIICVVFLFASNLAWLIAWNLPSENTVKEESYEMQGEDNANVILNKEGEVSFNEQDKGKDENKDNKEN